jgi:hypothetical protein
MKFRRPLTLAGIGLIAAGALCIAAPIAQATSPKGGEHKVTLCHATHSDTNPYVEETVDIASVIGPHGHNGHTGPVYDDTLKKQHIAWGDIIPAFNYPEGSYTGMNLTEAGLAILNNGCHVPPAPTSTPSKTPCPSTSSPTPTPTESTPSETPSGTPSPTPSEPSTGSTTTSPRSTAPPTPPTTVSTSKAIVLPPAQSSTPTRRGVTVLPAEPRLADTGADDWPLATLGVWLTMLGAAMIGINRRTRGKRA